MITAKLRELHYRELFLIGIYYTIIILSFIASIVDFFIGSKTDVYIDLLFGTLTLVSYLLLFNRKNCPLAAISIFWISVFIEFLFLEIHNVDFNIIFALFIPIIAYIAMPKKLIIINLALFYALLISYLVYSYANDPNNIFLHTKSYLIAYSIAHIFILSFGLFYNIAVEESIARLQKSNKAKEMLLNEVHHRVKNNLNLVASILALNAQTIDDAAIIEYLVSNQKRIESMAILHEILYKQDGGNSTDLTNYVNKLASHIIRSMAQKDVTINCDIEHLELPMDSMIQFGIMLNEMLTNSIKHKAKDSKLTISVIFKKCGEFYCLGYCDNSKFNDLEKLKRGFGFNLINLAAKHFKADVTIDTSDGLCYRVKLKRGWSDNSEP
jgi:two-component sensor histidine kinase